MHSAVLFLVFNRLDTAIKVFEAIRNAKPPRLYIAADGPRLNQPGDDLKVGEVRRYIESNIDWSCSCRYLYREINLGCKEAIPDALDWFFQNEEEGIILEDDVIPSLSFFYFCESMLERYRHDKRIGVICGTNLISDGDSNSSLTYSFSKHCLIWGWATWANRWTHYDKRLNNLDKFEVESALKEFSDGDYSFRIYWKMIYEKARKNLLTTWDFQLSVISFYHRWLNIIPSINMTKNIGYGDESTHTSGVEPEIVRKSKALNAGLDTIHPNLIVRDRVLDNAIDNYFLPSLVRLIASKIKYHLLHIV